MDIPDAELFGRTVLHSSGVRMGRIDVIVHQAGGTRLAVVRRGFLHRRWYHVSLDGAEMANGQVIAHAGFTRDRPGAAERRKERDVAG
jgi:hypothetical protein